MKKILAAIDGLKFSESTCNYAIELAKKSKAYLVGVFLDDYSYHSPKIYELVRSDDEISEQELKQYENEDKMSRDIAAANFKSACEEEAINYCVHHDRNIAIHELLHESIYADLVVIDAKETLTHYEENLPTRFVRELLSNVECPVLVVPNAFKQIKKIVLLYDGESASVYAIKLFSYLFPDLEKMETEIISVKTIDKDMQGPGNRLMKEFIKRHFPNAVYTTLSGLPDMEIVNYLKNRGEGELIVLGAYRRGAVSMWFKPSLADTLIQELRSPVFIAHNK